MTQEDKELLLKDLCGRYPYSVKVNVNGEIQTFDSLCDDDGYRFQFLQSDGITEGVNIENIKPYLRPMSSMTEEEKKRHDFYCGYKPYDENSGESYLTEYDMPDYMDFLLEHHLDFRGLIPKGLALEAPEGMYK